MAMQGEHSHNQLDHGSWEIMKKKSYRIPWRDLMYETPLGNKILVMHKKSPTSYLPPAVTQDPFSRFILPFNWVVKNEKYMILKDSSWDT